MAQLAIKGHTTRGKEVIEILEMLGGKSKNNIKGYNDDLYYYIAKDGLIYGSGIKYEEFACNYTIFTLEEFLEKYPYKVGDKVISLYGKLGRIRSLIWSERYNQVRYELEADVDSLYFANELQPVEEKETMEGKGTLVQIDLARELCIADKVEVILGDYEFVLKDGKTYFVKKKPQYPKTYEECCKIVDYHLEGATIIGYEKPLLENLQQLLICRDAYWKIAGEQMGLDKPWEYDMSKDEFAYAISYQYGSIQKCEVRYRNHFLVFPTKEMRDAFFENFKELINEVKELL